MPAAKPVVKIAWAPQPEGARLVLGSFDHRPTDEEIAALRCQHPDIEFDTADLHCVLQPKVMYRTRLVTDKPVVKVTWCPQPGPIWLQLGSFDHPPSQDEVNQLRAAYPYIEFEEMRIEN